jgi:hypothetical protein
LDDIGQARRCVFRLTVEVFSRACGLSRLPLELRLGIASHSADAFLDLATNVPSGPGYAILVHDHLPICIRLDGDSATKAAGPFSVP